MSGKDIYASASKLDSYRIMEVLIELKAYLSHGQAGGDLAPGEDAAA
jgi:hypothetical protein